MSKSYDDLVRRLVADPDNEIEEPEFHLRATLDVWIRVEDGQLTEIELIPESLALDNYPGFAFARDSVTRGDGPDLTTEEADAVWEQLTGGRGFVPKDNWGVRKIEDSDGRLYCEEV